LDFRYKADGFVEHSGVSSSDERSGARVNHGDRVVADALCYKMMVQLVGNRGPKETRPDPAERRDTLAFRRQLAAKADRDADLWAPELGLQSRYRGGNVASGGRMFQVEKFSRDGWSVIHADHDYGAAHTEFMRIVQTFPDWQVRFIQVLTDRTKT
jgi:hypothetical protein